MKTKLFSLFLVLAITEGTMFAERVKIGDLYYNLNAKSKTAEVTTSNADDDLWLEDNLNYMPYNYVGLETVNIPTSVTHDGLEYSVTSIGNYAFCHSVLQSVTIPNSVIRIGDYAFKYCGLKSVTIPNSVTSIGDEAFFSCERLTSLTIPSSITSIANAVFQYCRGLTSIEIPSSVTSIGSNAFRDCDGLTAVKIPSSVTSIGYGAFAGCSSLPIENNLRYADTYLVEAVNKSQYSYTIKEGTKWIGDDAFSKCTKMQSLHIPSSVTSIGYGAFAGCSSLPIENNLRYADTYLVEVVDKEKDQNVYVIKEGTKWIGEGAFSNYKSLVELYIPNSITDIGRDAFLGCVSLRSVTIPNSVTSIGNYAFSGSGLKSVTIPNSVTSIGGGVFSGCRYLSSPVYNAHVFVKLPTTYSGAYVIPDGVEVIAGDAFCGCTSLTSVTIPNSVTSIGWEAFGGCTGLTSVTIPNSVTSIGMFAFEGCTGLTSVTIPNSVTSIADYTFRGCKGLTSATIGTGVTSIGKEVFTYCGKLTSIVIADENPFYDSRNNCNAIVATSSNRLVQGCQSTIIPNDITSIGNSAFRECDGLTSVNIPNRITSIGNSAFSNCSSLKSVYISDMAAWCSILFGSNPLNGADLYLNGELVTDLVIPSSVTRLSAAAFRGCTSLTSVTIPNGVTYIGSDAFNNCTGLTSVTCYASTPPNLGSRVWENVNCWAIPLYVLEGQQVYFAYKTADQWKDFWSILPISARDTETTTTVATTTTETSVDVTWPSVSGAATYELVIKDKEGNVICTLTFNSNGQLTEIAFNTPSRNGAQQKTQTAGFSFTVTGLEAGTAYNLTITAKNASGQEIDKKNISFHTNWPNGIEELHIDSDKPVKVLMDGQIYILRGEKVYDAQGKMVK